MASPPSLTLWYGKMSNLHLNRERGGNILSGNFSQVEREFWEKTEGLGEFIYFVVGILECIVERVTWGAAVRKSLAQGEIQNQIRIGGWERSND